MFKADFYAIGDWLVEKAIQLRGKTSNRLATLVAIAGIGLLSEPIWAPIVSSIAKKYFELDISLEANPVIGLLLIIISLFYHYLISKNERGELSFADEDRRMHDASVFSQLKSTLPFIETREIFDWILTHHSIFSDDRSRLVELTLFLKAHENEFLSKEMSDCQSNYAKPLNDLISFMTYSFFTYPDFKTGPNNQFQFCLHPHWNSDREGDGSAESDRKYAEKAVELENRVNSCQIAMSDLIGKAKREIGATSIQ